MMQNPFNGIESLINQVIRFHVLLEFKNPFNGIERLPDWCRQRLPSYNTGNPFNGIERKHGVKLAFQGGTKAQESIQWNWKISFYGGGGVNKQLAPESIQWNWKWTYRFHQCSWSPALRESIQWNWKRQRGTRRGLGAPGGIHSMELKATPKHTAKPTSPHQPGIHSMELKAGRPRTTLPVCSRSNPFNGIESDSNVALKLIVTLCNESIQWNWKSTGSWRVASRATWGTGIHSMELKVYQTNPMHGRNNHVESIQWNWKRRRAEEIPPPPEEKESIQWNWKSTSSIGQDLGWVLGIHSMELKGEVPCEGRSRNRDSDDRDSDESIQWNWKFWHRSPMARRLWQYRIHSMELKDRPNVAISLRRNTSHGIHSMELKVGAGEVVWQRQHWGEFIQWNWKTSHTGARPHLVQDESIQWNWKYTTISQHSTISSTKKWIHSMELKEYTSFSPWATRALTRIHSMELKGVEVEAVVAGKDALIESIQWNWKAYLVSFVHSAIVNIKNPFNGIESQLARR